MIVTPSRSRVVVIPALPSGRGTGSATWTRLASLAHRANALLVALGVEASSELRYFASVRLETAIERVRWNGASGHLCELAGYDIISYTPSWFNMAAHNPDGSFVTNPFGTANAIAA